MLTPFHLAIAVRDIDEARIFYGGLLGCAEGGVVLEMADWRRLAERLRQAGVEFLIEPHVRFAGQAGEQATLFFRDPSGNALEFKAFRDIAGQLFAR